MVETQSQKKKKNRVLSQNLYDHHSSHKILSDYKRNQPGVS